MTTLIIYCVLLQVFSTQAHFLTLLEKHNDNIKNLNNKLSEIHKDAIIELDGIKDYQKSIFNDEYLKDAFTDIENMVAAVELEGKNASKCVEWGKFIGGEVKKHYYNDTEVCYNRQKENLNNIYDSLQQTGKELEIRLDNAAKTCLELKKTKWAIKGTIKSEACAGFKIKILIFSILPFVSNVNSLQRNTQSIIFNNKNDLSDCYQKAWDYFLESLDNNARYVTEECIQRRTGTRPRKLELD